MRVDVCDVMVVAGCAALITGLFLIGTIAGLVGGGALLITAGLLLARLRARAE